MKKLITMTIMVLPVVTTDAVTVISGTTATSGGTVTSSDGTAILSRGLCWSQHLNPTIDDNVALAGLGQGHFTADLTGLFADSLYYVRAFAATAHGVAYGQPRVFVSGNSSAITVTVHFESSDTAKGTVTQTDTTVIYGGSITFPNVTAARGWRFSYWMQEGDTTHYTANDHPQLTATATFVACFRKDVQYKFSGTQDTTWHDCWNTASDMALYAYYNYSTPKYAWADYGYRNTDLFEYHIPVFLNKNLKNIDSENGVRTIINTHGLDVDVYIYDGGWILDEQGFSNPIYWEHVGENLYGYTANNLSNGKATIGIHVKD